MSTWKTKLFGDNALNFWGWNVAGLGACVASALIVVVAIKLGLHSGTDMLLLAIYLVLISHFCLGLSNYFARVSEKLDAQKQPGEP